MRSLIFATLLGLSPLVAQAPTPAVPNAQEVGIDEKLGGLVAKDLTLKDESGQSVTLASLLTKPTVLTLNYFRCAGICTPQLNGLTDVINGCKLELGKDYQIITVSFDDRDTPEIAAQKRTNYLSQLKRPVPPEGWRFLTTDAATSRAIAASVGFKFKKEGEDFLHAGALMLLSPEGRVTRYMYGVAYLPADLEMAVQEAARGEARPTINKFLKFCFNVDPSGRITTLNITRVSGLVLILGAVIFGIVVARRGRRKAQTSQEG